jgi:serine/threonine protein kinase
MGHYIFKHTLNCAFVGADETFIFQATSWNSVNTQVFKERILTAICDLDDRTFGQNSKLQVNVLQCKYMVRTIVTSKCYLMGETCATLADPIYEELFRIVKKADLLVQDCSDEPLNLKSILVEMDNICAFVAVIVDWQSCTRLFRKDSEDWTWESVHSRLEPLKAQDIQKNKELWDPHIAELRQLMSNAGGSRTGERINFADYLQWRVQNVMNAYDLPQGLLPWCDLASDPEAKRGKFLGNGTSGSVSQYTWFGMACAEKSFFNPLFGEKQKRDFENEVGVMVRLNHPHLVRLICCHVNRDSTECSIVMELMPKTLERHIAERKASHKPFTPQAAVDVMSQIASGMEYLHGQQVVHRDLKPNNILVSPNTDPELSAEGYVEVKLADFGLAKTKVNTSSSMLHSRICGTYQWRAPEAFQDREGHPRSFPPRKADVYSFGILCSQILSGKLHPFGNDAWGLRERISSPKKRKAIFAFEHPLPCRITFPDQPVLGSSST